MFRWGYEYISIMNFKCWFIINEGIEEKELARELAGDDSVLFSLNEVIPQAEEINPHQFIIHCYKELLKTKVDLGGGNCGMVSLAIHHILESKGIKSAIGLISNAETEEELMRGEPDIYHVYTIHDNQRYDEAGPISDQYLSDLASDQYGNNNPNEFIFDDSEINEITKIIRVQTNWNVESIWFQNKLKNM